MRVCLWLLMSLCLLPLSASAVEFNEGDMLPRPERVAFDRDRVYFLVDLALPQRKAMWFAFDRKTHELSELPVPPSSPELKSPAPTYNADGNLPMDSDGNLYSVEIPDCDESATYDSTLQWAGGPKLDFNGVLPDCTGPGTVERFGHYLLIGAYQSGDYPSVVEPVLALDDQSHKPVKSFDFAASVIRRDPYADQVWMVGPSGISAVDAGLNVKERRSFYYGFRPGDHALALLLSDTPRKDDALAVVGDDLRVPDWQAWYKAVSALPATARDGYDLYEFVMAFPSDLSYGYLPKELNTLLPFFMDAIAREKDPNRVRSLLGSLCRFDDPRVDDYLNKQVSTGAPYANPAGECLKSRESLRLKAGRS